LEEVVQVREDLGYPIMVTPFSQFVVTQAAVNVMLSERYKEVSDETIKAETRRKLGPNALIFGELDAYNVLCLGKPDQVERAVKEAIDAGVNAVWPGYDIWPTVPKENMEMLMTAARKYGELV